MEQNNSEQQVPSSNPQESVENLNEKLRLLQAQFDVVINEKDKVIKEKDKVIKEKVEQIKEKVEQIKEKEEQIKEKEEQIKEKEEQILQTVKLDFSKQLRCPSSNSDISSEDKIKNSYENLDEFNIRIGNRNTTKIKETPSLYYSKFGNFANNIENTTPDDDCVALAIEYFPLLCRNYPEEDVRQIFFEQLLRKLFNETIFLCHSYVSFPTNTSNQSGMRNVVCDLIVTSQKYQFTHQANIPSAIPQKEVLNEGEGKRKRKYNTIDVKKTPITWVPEVIFEIKNELGSTKYEPVIQAANYYAHFSRIAAYNTSKAAKVWPTFLVVYAGRIISVYGATTLHRPAGEEDQIGTTHFLHEHLCTFNFDICDMASGSFILAKLFHTLRDGVTTLQKWRKKVQMDGKTVIFPWNLIKDKYFLQNNFNVTLFPQKLVYLNGNRVWKFTRTYSELAHKKAAELGIAPILYYATKLSNDWTIVCMEKVTGEALTDQTIISELEKEAWKKFKTQLELFWNEFVHGDMRSDNILYGNINSASLESKYYIVDFDWAGKENECRYPLSINMDEVDWHEDVKPFGKLLAEHDKYWISKMDKILS